MTEKQIEQLNRQIDKLNNKNFDLEAWKKHTAIVLGSIFGDGSMKVKQIEQLDYEYNSWSLRDTTGHSSYLDSCKKLGREILESSIEELQIKGMPAPSENKPETIELSVILEALDDELKGSQYKAMMNLLKSDISEEEKSRQLNDIIKELGNETLIAILKGILIQAIR